jgi:hypothetical protein
MVDQIELPGLRDNAFTTMLTCLTGYRAGGQNTNDHFRPWVGPVGWLRKFADAKIGWQAWIKLDVHPIPFH